MNEKNNQSDAPPSCKAASCSCEQFKIAEPRPYTKREKAFVEGWSFAIVASACAWDANHSDAMKGYTLLFLLMSLGLVLYGVFQDE